MLTATYRDRVRRLIDQTSQPSKLLYLDVKHRISTLKSEFTHLMAQDDDYFRISDSNKRLDLSPVNPEHASDPIYQKVSSLENYLGPKNGRAWTYAGMIRDKINEIQMKIERRQMKAEEYTELLAVSSEDLLNEWVDEAEKRLEALWMMS